jgi:four helix bundle protein
METENRKVKIENGTPAPRAPAGKISDFTELETWKFARALRRRVYQIANTFPADEKYGLTSQMRRAAISATANIAEGYGRYSYQENVQFCRQARGSLYELRDHLTTALDAGYLSKEIFAELDATAVSAIRLVNGYIRATRNLKLSMPERPKK